MRAFGESSALDIDRPAAAKTGTTSDWRDNWTVGYTPDRAVGVWVGNADGQPMEAISGVSGAGPVWHEVMLAAHRGLPPRQFARPDGIVEVAICAEGGLLPAPDCPAARLERFVAGTQPMRRDDTHVRVMVDAALSCRAPAGYPAERAVTRVFRILPPGAETWAVAAGLPRVPHSICSAPTTDHRPPTTEDQGLKIEDSNVSAGETGSSILDSRSSNNPSVVGRQPSVVLPALLSPASGAVFAISPGIPRERQRITFTAQAGGDAAKLAIYLDGQPLATLAGPPYRTFWQLAPGTHRAWVETYDERGRIMRSAEVEFVVTQQP
jgi:membrane carboxypeptidase/penicillin-binding protein PbpC